MRRAAFHARAWAAVLSVATAACPPAGLPPPRSVDGALVFPSGVLALLQQTGWEGYVRAHLDRVYWYPGVLLWNGATLGGFARFERGRRVADVVFDYPEPYRDRTIAMILAHEAGHHEFWARTGSSDANASEAFAQMRGAEFLRAADVLAANNAVLARGTP